MSRISRWIAGSLPLLLALMLVLGLAQIALAAGVPDGAGDDSGRAAADNGNGKGNQGNRGNSDNGKGNDKDNEKDKDKDKKDKKEKNEQQTGPVTAAGGYSIDVQCLYQEVDDHTTCTFTGVALEDAKKINHLVVPVDALCAEVLGSDAKFVDPDPNTHVTGYRTPGSTATTAIVLAGRVTADGKATYWFKTGGNVFPVTGPGLACTAAEPEAAAPTEAPATETPVMTPTPDVTDSSGAVLVQVYQCPIASADAVGADYDWYGACAPGGGNHTFELTGTDASSAGQTLATADDGQIQFGDVAPGRYALTLTDGAWCHAESDEVDADGNVIVTAGEQTTVWIFTCAGA
jgi:hypothetical protein